MFSPGKWHEQVPKTVKENLLYRRAVLDKCRSSRLNQKIIVEACRQDILFFINVFGWQYDPTQSESRAGPFIAWPCQERILTSRPEANGKCGLLWCIENKQPVVWEKSREMGATWLFLFASNWLCAFHRNFQVLNISKSADAVDCKSRNSLFAKVRFINKHCPNWLIGEVGTQKMHIEYERTDSENTGEASSSRSGVGGRGGLVNIDEAAEIEELADLREKLTSTAPCRLFVSTHLGTGNEFYRITDDDVFVKWQLHWSQHPEKNKGLYRWNSVTCKDEQLIYNDAKDDVEVVASNGYDYFGFEFDRTGKPTGGPFPGVRSPWYDKKAAEIGNDRGVAMQLDINPSGSVSQFYNPIKIRDLQRFCTSPYWSGRLTYDQHTGEPVEFIEVENGPIKLWLNLRDGLPPVSKYGAGADVSGGSGNTPSCLTIWNARTGEKVLEFQDSNMEPKAFATFCVAVCRMFKDEHGAGAKLAWEHVGPGCVFGGRVWRELNYLHVWCSPKRRGDMSETDSQKPGWSPNAPGNILQLHEDYRIALYNRNALNRSWQALAETLQFKYTANGSVEHTQFRVKGNDTASRENHGDVVIGDALGWMVAKGGMRESKKERDAARWNDPRTFAGREAMDLAERELEECWD